MVELFLCEKYNCKLTCQACAERRAARRLHASSRSNIPTYPGCQECVKGEKMAAGIRTDHIVPTYPGQKHKPKQEEVKMAYPRKVNDEKLKKMIAEGKFIDEIAKEIGVVAISIRFAAKRLGLTLNYRRKLATRPVPANPVDQSRWKASAPVPASAVDLTYKRFAPPSPSRGDGSGGGNIPAQIIPVTLRLTVEVNVRVHAGA